MSGSVNKVILIGRLGADPEVRTFQNGGSICNLRIATSEQWKDRQTGEKRERTEWHQVTITSDGLIKIAEQFLRKGLSVYIEGQLQTRKWQDQSGNDRYTTEIVVKPYNGSIVLLEFAEGRRSGSDGGYSGNSGSGGGYGHEGGYGGSHGPHGFPDDEIPF